MNPQIPNGLVDISKPPEGLSFSPSELNRRDRRKFGKRTRMKIVGVNKPIVKTFSDGML